MGNCIICFKEENYEFDENSIADEICDIYPPTFEEFDDRRKKKIELIDIMGKNFDNNKNVVL